MLGGKQKYDEYKIALKYVNHFYCFPHSLDLFRLWVISSLWACPCPVFHPLLLLRPPKILQIIKENWMLQETDTWIPSALHLHDSKFVNKCYQNRQAPEVHFYIYIHNSYI